MRPVSPLFPFQAQILTTYLHLHCYGLVSAYIIYCLEFYIHPLTDLSTSILNRAYQVIFRKCKVYQVVVLLEIPHRNPFHWD